MPYALISSDKTSLFACIPLRSQAEAVLAMIWIAMTAGNLCQGLEKLGEAPMMASTGVDRYEGPGLD